jgi:hypothetical protein
MNCTTGTGEAGPETAGDMSDTEPLTRIEHGLDAALEQMDDVSRALTECTQTLLMVPLEQVALAARVGVVMSDLRMMRLSLGTLVIRPLVPDAA